MPDKLKILFLCTGNSCRSQMAEGWTRHLKDDLIEPWSAGIVAKGLDPRAMRVMTEAGIDISGQTSKSLESIAGVVFDYVVTVCDHAAEACPIFPGKTTQIHRGFDDPPRLAEGSGSEEEAMEIYRRVRDEIRKFVMGLPESLKTMTR